MVFDNITTDDNKIYINIILNIIRKGISNYNLKIQKEESTNQELSNKFNYIGTKNKDIWLGCGTEHVNKGTQRKEDIYFYLNDDNNTKVFLMEAKRLPKAGVTSCENSYVIGPKDEKSSSGGIQRYKLGVHGQGEMKEYGMLGYIENKECDFLEVINTDIKNEYGKDEIINKKEDFENEYKSKHRILDDNSRKFTMHHFWINKKHKKNLTEN